MIKIPSYTTSILTGAIIMPLSTLVSNYAEERHYSQVIIFLWDVIGFMIPMILATADIGYLRRTGGIFKIRASYDDFILFYFPTWKRMFVWLIATGCSFFILKLIEIKI